MTPSFHSLWLLDRVSRARLICAQVLTETGGLLHDDPCVQEMLEAEAALAERDRAHGYEPARRIEIEQRGRVYGRNAQAVRR